VNFCEVAKKKCGIIRQHFGLVRRCNLRYWMCMMTVWNIYILCLLQLSIISLNCYNVYLYSNSDETYIYLLRLSSKEITIWIQIIQTLLFTAYFDVHVTVHRDKFLIIKPIRCTNFSNLFWNETLHVSDSPSDHLQEFFTVHTAMVYVIHVCWQLASRIRMEQDSKTAWRIPLLCVQLKTPDGGQRNCPKHVEFHFKINLRNECI